MRPFHKGQRLIKLCDQKTRAEQQVLSRNVRQRQNLIEEIERCKAELHTLEQLMLAQQLNDVSATKADIYELRRQQALLLYQRQQLRVEYGMRLEDLDDIDNEIMQCQRQIAFLKRREMKFTKWTQSTKKEWLLQRETTYENEQQENITWRLS
ncbi:MAG: hypothetical protein K0R08_2059 [Solimicrobium sp.]|jgi:hypothetical protein|nr:hypothetical protein [Solimicrobium sp.]